MLTFHEIRFAGSLQDLCRPTLSHQVPESVVLHGKFHVPFLPDIIDGNAGEGEQVCPFPDKVDFFVRIT
jgi:hypothetical protein